MILTIVAHLELELYQMDVKIAFLNGELEEEIYIQEPVGFVVLGQEQNICKLQKSIYGLKHFSRQWNLKFHQTIISYDFEMIDKNHCVYVKCYNNLYAILFMWMKF